MHLFASSDGEDLLDRGKSAAAGQSFPAPDLDPYKASEVLARADRDWLGRLITRVEKPADFARALHRDPDDIKVVIQFAEL